MRAGPSVLGIVLAGGEGKRLMPLTADRAKPAVTFGGTYRLVDFVLSNLVNAGILRICVLTQYKSHPLDRHVTTTWRMSSLLGNYVTPVPAQQRLGPRWYLGSADAILQSLNLVHDEQPDYIAVFGADHVYRMDARQMLERHIESGAGVTVAGIKVPRAEASAFGVITPACDGSRVKRFLEKPVDPPGLPDDPAKVFASMGNYLSEQPLFSLYNHRWPMYTHTGHQAPARFVSGGIAGESIVSPGCVIRGQITGSVLSPGVIVEQGAVVQGSVLHHGVRVGRGAVVRNAILDKNVDVPPGATIGVNPERDRQLYTVSHNGVIALGKGRAVA
ncbi:MULTISPECIES: sugar phosphate nucleotidyltransferase [unclassified Streptomyces]|uniref:sugar phosphate nucleotidyltransferase n=1 Tax=unclassified Streptomyces TaxID=2593676 RepID=UPI0009354070|nr:sugar phosphate nucleotidyltransferase [Streptomyces sp. NBRC 110465]